MSEKPHTVAIGAFIVGALLIAITTVIFILGTGLDKERVTVVMVFEGSVKGLSIGAPVALRGVQIGQVTDIDLILDTDTSELIMMVEADLQTQNVQRRGNDNTNLAEELIARGLRAQLNTQSLLTGLLYIQLDFHPETPVRLADIDSPHIQIPTIPTGLERLTREVKEIDLAKITSDLESTLASLNEFVTNDAFQEIPDTLQEALSSMQALSEQLQRQLAATGSRLDRALDGASETFDAASVEMKRLSPLLQNNLDSIERAAVTFELALDNVQELSAPDSATVYELNRALRDLSDASRALQALAKTLEEQPEALIRGKSGKRP